MDKAIAVEKSVIKFDSGYASFAFASLSDPNTRLYIIAPETRPFKVIRAFRTEVNGKELPGVIVLVKNSDGSFTKNLSGN